MGQRELDIDSGGGTVTVLGVNHLYISSGQQFGPEAMAQRSSQMCSQETAVEAT